jgi:uncharacterized protein YegJ (DUF2314 family)
MKAALFPPRGRFLGLLLPAPIPAVLRGWLFPGLLLAAGFLAPAACSRSIRGGGLNPIMPAQTADPVLGAIASGAREHLSEFTRRLQNPAKDEYNFQVKYPFEADGDSGYTHEHLWIRNIEFKDGAYYGILANEPFYIKGLALGDRVEFFLGGISDWMYMKGKRIRGGWSIKYFIEKIPAADRDEELRRYLELFEY